MIYFWASLFGFWIGFSINRFRRKGEAFDLVMVSMAALNLALVVIETW